MDVPSWHPANQDADAARRLLMAPAAVAPRTEFKVMPGSSADTSTEAGRQLMNDLSGGGDGGAAFGGRGFFDASDRLYLQEQRKIEEAQKSRRKAEEDAQLQSFRSTSLKLQQAQRPLLTVTPDVIAPKTPGGSDPTQNNTSSSSKKKPLSAVVTIKPKKRSAATEVASESSNKKAKPAKKQSLGAPAESNRQSTEVSPRTTGSTSKPSTKTASAATTTTTTTAAAAAAGKSATPTAVATSGSLLLGYSSSSDSEGD